jgi:hypothetical protein
MSDLFDNVKPGSRVHYLTPQGQTRSGTVVMNKGTHLVLNRGGGQPQVVTPKNYVKHSSGGKVQGALLSNLAKSMKKEEAEQIDEISKKTKDSYIAKRGSQLSSFLYGSKRGVVQNAMTGRKQKNAVYGLKRATGKPVGLNAIASFSTEELKVGDRVKLKKEEAEHHKLLCATCGFGAVGKKHKPDPYEDEYCHSCGDPVTKNGVLVPYKPNKKKTVKEDAKDMEGAAERVAKTKKKRKKLVEAAKKFIRKGHDFSSATKFSVPVGHGYPKVKDYIDRLKANEIPHRKGYSPYQGHISFNVPYSHHRKASKILYGEEVEINEISNDTLVSYTGKAIKSARNQAGAADMARRIHTPERAKYFADKANKIIAKRNKGVRMAVGKIASKLPATPVNEVSAPGKEDWIVANKARFIARYGKEKGLRILYAKAWKDSKTNEEGERAAAGRAAERSWVADLASRGPSMAQSASNKTGHYLMRGGRKLSGPHTPDEAVKQYKGMSDSKGVKIVHVKEASDNKLKKAANKAIAIAKNNVKVDTKPALNIPAHGTHGPMEASHSDSGAEDAKI